MIRPVQHGGNGRGAMKLTTVRRLRLVVNLTLLSALALAFQACTTSGRTPDQFRSAKRVARPPVTTPVKPVSSEDPDRLRVEYDSRCAQAGPHEAVELDGFMSLPAYATAATVALIGWKFRYIHAQHHISWVSARIEEVSRQGSELRWKALGGIFDDSFDDPFEFCYHYVAVAWNQAALDATPYDNATHRNCLHYNSEGLGGECFGAHSDTALSVIPSYVRNAGFSGNRSVAVLPRGFVAIFTDSDHHVLQFGYARGHAERIVQLGTRYGVLPIPEVASLSAGSSVVNDEFVSWRSLVILKDNDRRRDVAFHEYSSVLGGNDLDVIQPSFVVKPNEESDASGCITGGGPRTITHEADIRKAPFDYAIPLLTGWELGVGCRDRDIREIGVWIHDVQYAKGPPGIPVGRLQYKVSTVFRDDSDDAHYSRYNAHILGFSVPRPATGTPTPSR